MAKKKPETPEGYTVLARRYRPQQFADLVGQEPVARALVNALESGRVAHAYLFTGARGVGKTSTARILAKALNCVKGPTATPCDECSICQSITSGDDVDVLEIDGASNRGIDEVREIRQNVAYRPSRARYKIYIIDEVHMLTAPAFNALLKTLEEPPPHVKFIFATTEVQKIPVTILSRCQRFDFAGIGTPKIVERLREVVEAEGMQADDEALERIARRAGGSMRDAQSLLDQLLAFGGDRLTAEQVHRLLGTAQDDRVLALAAAIGERDARKALELVGQAADEGLQLGELLDQLIDYWRDLMLINCAGPDQVGSLSVSGRHRDTLVGQAQCMSVDTIMAGLDILSSTKARLRGSSHARVLMEMAAVRLARLDDLVPLAQLSQALVGGARLPIRAEASDSVKKKVRSEPESSHATTVPSASYGTSAHRITANSGVGEPATARAVADEPKSEVIVIKEDTLISAWQIVLGKLPPFLASQIEKAGLPAIIGPNTLALRFSAEYNHHRDHCQRPETTGRIEEALRTLTGQAWNLRIESVGSAAAAAEAAAPTEAARDVVAHHRRHREQAEKEPLIQRAVEILGAQILKVDEGFGMAPTLNADEADNEE